MMAEVNYVEALKMVRETLVQERRKALDHGMKRVAEVVKAQQEIDAIDRAIEDERRLEHVP